MISSDFRRQVEYERHQKEHKIIDQFQGNVEKCREAEVKFHGEELKIYGERMTVLQKAYNELLVLSNKRVSDLHSLYDFMQVRKENSVAEPPPAVEVPEPTLAPAKLGGLQGKKVQLHATPAPDTKICSFEL